MGSPGSGPKPQRSRASFALGQVKNSFQNFLQSHFNQPSFWEHLATTWHPDEGISSFVFSANWLLICMAGFHLSPPARPPFWFLNSTAAARCADKPRGGRKGHLLSVFLKPGCPKQTTRLSPVTLMPARGCAFVREHYSGLGTQL